MAHLKINIGEEITPPIVHDNSIKLNTQQYLFTLDSFTKDFSDPEGGTYDLVTIKSLIGIDGLRYNGSPLLIEDSFPVVNSTYITFDLDPKYSIHNGVLYEYEKDIDLILADHSTLGLELVANTNGLLTFIDPETLALTYVQGKALPNDTLAFKFTTSSTVSGLPSNEATFSMIPWENVNLKDNFYSVGGGASDGDSAYQVWLNQGNVGTEQDYLNSLIGPQGEPGTPGQDGTDGTSVTIKGSYATVTELEAAHPTGALGDGYLVNGYLYVWNGTAWQNVGLIQGPRGYDGRGLEYTWRGTELGVRYEGQLNYAYVQLKGATGDKGEKGDIGLQGLKGDTGLQGVQGIQGPIGPDGKSLEFVWNGTQLGVRKQGDTTYVYTQLKGDKGDTGAPGKDGKDGVDAAFTHNEYVFNWVTGQPQYFTVPDATAITDVYVDGKRAEKNHPDGTPDEWRVASATQIRILVPLSNNDRVTIVEAAKYSIPDDLEVVKSVTGSAVDNTDPQNPVINLQIIPEPEEGQTIVYKDHYSDFPPVGVVDTLYVDNEKGIVYIWSVELNDYKEEGKTQVQSDWNEADNTSPSYIRNRPNTNESFRAFISKWVVTAGQTVTLPLSLTANYDFEVDWGDGTTKQQVNSGNSVYKAHTYTEAGTYSVSIKGVLDYFKFADSNTEPITEIVQWGDIVWKEISFRDCSGLATLPTTDYPNLTQVSSLLFSFANCNISVIPSNIFTLASNVTDFRFVFRGNSITTIPGDLFDNCLSAVLFDSAFKVNQITEVPAGLFKGCINARSFKEVFRENALITISEDMVANCILATNFQGMFFLNTITSVPKNLFKYNKRANNFYETFRYNNITSEVPELWLDFPTADSGNCFAHCGTPTNIAEIPTTWGGNAGVEMPTQKPVDGRAYWDEATSQPVWYINDTWVTVSGNTVSGLDVRMTNLVNDLNSTEKNTIKTKLGITGEGTAYDDTDIQANVRKETLSFALSSPSADLTSGDTDSFHAPYAFTLVSYFVGVVEAPTGSALVVGLKKAGVSVNTSDAIIDANETTSLTGTAPVLNGTVTFAKGDKITPVISQVGSLTTGKSLKIYLEIIKTL